MLHVSPLCAAQWGEANRFALLAPPWAKPDFSLSTINQDGGRTEASSVAKGVSQVLFYS